MSDWQNGAVLIPPFGNFHSNQLIKLRVMPAKFVEPWLVRSGALNFSFFNNTTLTLTRPTQDPIMIRIAAYWTRVNKDLTERVNNNTPTPLPQQQQSQTNSHTIRWNPRKFCSLERIISFCRTWHTRKSTQNLCTSSETNRMGFRLVLTNEKPARSRLPRQIVKPS